MSRSVFYDAVRPSLFGGRLTAEHVAGIDCILDERWRRGERPGNDALYVTAATFFPHPVMPRLDRGIQ